MSFSLFLKYTFIILAAHRLRITAQDSFEIVLTRCGRTAAFQNISAGRGMKY
jgi:hypothetical protein